MMDIKKVKDEAVKEYLEEKMAVAKEKLKRKMKELDSARTIVRNIERELSELEVEITNGIS